MYICIYVCMYACLHCPLFREKVWEEREGKCLM